MDTFELPPNEARIIGHRIFAKPADGKTVDDVVASLAAQGITDVEIDRANNRVIISQEGTVDAP